MSSTGEEVRNTIFHLQKYYERTCIIQSLSLGAICGGIAGIFRYRLTLPITLASTGAFRTFLSPNYNNALVKQLDEIDKKLKL